RLRVPFSIKARGSDIRYWGQKYRARRQMVGAGRHAQGLLAVSKALRDDMTSLGLSRERITVHYTGVDLDRFAPSAAAKTAAPTLLAVGNLVSLKRFDLLIDMMVHLPGVRLEIIGDGDERSHLEGLINKLELQDRVRLLGRVPHDELPARLAAAHALVHASESEGLANVWVEALACGTPVATCNVGGAKEVVTPSTGRLLSVDVTPIRFATAVRELLAEPPRPGAAREAALPFSWERNTDQLYDHLAMAAGR
ncbi:MAG: glycosyltransferase, partial [Pacificimonas sp.]